MSTIELRDTVKDYVNIADVKLLKLMKALAETYQNDKSEIALTDEQYKLIDKRRKAHLEGKSKSFTWEKTKDNARNLRV